VTAIGAQKFLRALRASHTEERLRLARVPDQLEAQERAAATLESNPFAEHAERACIVAH